jgi:hypothetical protein
MRKYIPAYYLLCVLLILGAFSAMAQNSYGLTLLGAIAALFSLVFLVQFITYLTKTKSNRDSLVMLEYFSLILISAILSLRVFYIRFLLVEEIFILAGIVLAVVYVIRLVRNYRVLILESKIMAWTILLFHASIILYITSMTLTPLYPPFSEPAGILAFLSLIAFTISAIINKNILIQGEKKSPFSLVKQFRDHSIILTAIFLIFTGYMGLTKIGLVPRMYTDEYPQAYFELVNKADAGLEDVVNGKYKHEEFKEMYDRFVSRNSVSGQK